MYCVIYCITSLFGERFTKRLKINLERARGHFNKTFPNKCNLQVRLLFLYSKTIATFANYTCKSFIKLAPGAYAAVANSFKIFVIVEN